jgi:cytochrome P450
MAAADHVIAAGTARATMVPAGSVVFAVAASAMADETELDNPSAFRIGRPAHHYLLFGSGTHSCLGREVSEAVLAAALRPVLERPGLRRSTEPDRPTADGSAPGGLVVEFDAGSAGAAPASSS